MNSPTETPDIETASAAYAERFAGEWGEYLLSRQEYLVDECLAQTQGKALLSVGGGHAQLTGLYTRKEFAITVYGSEGASVELLAPYDVEYQSGNILSLPYQDNAFDVVVAIRLLTHLRNWPTLLKEMCRVSRGMVIIEYPSKRSLNFISPLLFKLKKQIEIDTRPFQLFSDSKIKAELSVHGYQTTYRRGQFFFPLVLHRLLKSNRILRAIEALLSALRLSCVFGSPIIMAARKKS